MNKKSVIDVTFTYALLEGALNFVVPYLTVVGLLLLIFATQESSIYWEIFTAVLVFVPSFWIIDALFKGWSKVILYLLVLGILLAVMLVVPTYFAWPIKQLILFVSTFVASRALLAYLSMSQIPYHRAISEFIGVITQVLWTIAGYWIIATRLSVGTTVFGIEVGLFYLFINIISAFFSTSLLVVILIWRTTKLTNIVEKLKLVSTWSLEEGVVETMLGKGDDVTLQPTKRAIMFGDIRGFTAFSEVNYTEKVVEALNEMYHLVDEVVLSFGGAKPEFIADEFITYFDEPQVAADCSVEIIQVVNSALAKFKLGVGIGIDYGGILEGFIGSASTKKYTVIGSHVNTAARLQSKAELGEILVSNDVRSRISGYRLRLVPGIEMKGIASDFRVYSIKYLNSQEDETAKLVGVGRILKFLKFNR